MKKLLIAALLATASNAFATSPSESCRASLRRFHSVPVSMLAQCRYANFHSARAINFFTHTYNASFPQTMLEALLRIDSAEEANCAINMARIYNGSMNDIFLYEVCL